MLSKPKLFAITILFLLSQVCYADGAYLENLDRQVGKFKQEFTDAQSKTIFTEEVAASKKPFWSRLFSNVNEGRALKAEAKELLVFMGDTNAQFRNLSRSGFKLASTRLLEIDSLSQNHVGWGNLLVKLSVLNNVLYWMHSYLQQESEVTGQSTLDELFALHLELRHHLPSRIAVTGIALRHYDINILPLETFNFTISIADQGEKLEQSVIDYFGSEDRANKALLDLHALESDLNVNTFSELLDTPAPWKVAQSISNYADFWWVLYMKLKIMQTMTLSGDFKPGEELSQELLLEILNEAHKGDIRPWMPRQALDVVAQPDIFLLQYWKAIKKGRTLKLLSKHKLMFDGEKKIDFKRFSATMLH